MEASTDTAALTKDPATRQVLVNIGNRYVVFGLPSVFPGRPILGPRNVRQQFSERVGDEYDFPHDRLVQSVQVDNAEVLAVHGPDRGWDIELLYPDGSKTLVEIKVRTRGIINREFDDYLAWLKQIKAKGGGEPEIWNFNIERLRLNIMVVDTSGIPRFYEMEPLNIWEFNADGGTFERSHVVDRVANWLTRIGTVYSSVENWSAGLGVIIDKSRTVLMSEELMQKFAVPDKELSILDLNKDDKSLLSFVPVGLWVLGSNGRIDVISKQGTALLLDEARFPDPPKWSLLVNRSQRRFEPWNKQAFLKLIEAAEAS